MFFGVFARGALRSSFHLELSLWFHFFRWPSVGMADVVKDFIVPDTVEVEDGIVDVVVGLRCSQAEGAGGDYVRYTGRRVFVEEVFSVCPAGTVTRGVLRFCASSWVLRTSSWTLLIWYYRSCSIRWWTFLGSTDGCRRSTFIRGRTTLRGSERLGA